MVPPRHSTHICLALANIDGMQRHISAAAWSDCERLPDKAERHLRALPCRRGSHPNSLHNAHRTMRARQGKVGPFGNVRTLARTCREALRKGGHREHVWAPGCESVPTGRGLLPNVLGTLCLDRPGTFHIGAGTGPIARGGGAASVARHKCCASGSRQRRGAACSAARRVAVQPTSAPRLATNRVGSCPHLRRDWP